MDQVGWLAHFAQAQRDAIDAEHQRIAEKIRAEHEHADPRVAVVVLEPGSEPDPLGDSVSPLAARRLATSATMHGWRVRIVSSLAAVPSKGLIEVVTVRFARHDERGFAAWWNGRFDCAQYLRAGQGIERLGWRTTAKVRGVLDAIEGIQLTRQDAADTNNGS